MGWVYWLMRGDALASIADIGEGPQQKGRQWTRCTVAYEVLEGRPRCDRVGKLGLGHVCFVNPRCQSQSKKYKRKPVRFQHSPQGSSVGAPDLCVASVGR